MSLFRRPSALLLAVTLLLAVSAGEGAASGAGATGEGSGRDVRLRLEYLASAGLMESVLFGTRPMKRAEAARLIEEARETVRLETEYGGAAKDHAGYDWVDGHLESLAEESGQWTTSEPKIYLKPVGSPALRYLYLEGPASPVPGINSVSRALVYNNGGIEPREGSNGYMEFSAEGALGPLSMTVRPLVWVDDEWDGKVREGFLRLTLGWLDIEAGKRGLWWGQGYHGGLFLTENAEALPMVRLTNPTPAVLPWILRYLGPVRFDVFAARLEKERDVPEPYFTGMRLNLKPHPALEIGFTRTIIMGGEGRPGVTFDRFWKIMFGDNRERKEDLSNSMAGMDVRITFPWVQVYGEMGGEDEAGGLPIEHAYIVGLYAAIPGTGVDMRVEYADLTNTLWYRHSLYSSGYTYKGRILGHHVGRGAKDLFAEVGFTGSRFKARVKVDYEERGITTEPVTEKHHQAGFEIESVLGRFFSEWSLAVEAGVDRVVNAAYVDGAERDDFIFALALKGLN